MRSVLAVLVLAVVAGAQQAADGRPSRRCGLDEATCGDGTCINADYICDGRQDCPDGSDENRCSTRDECEPNEMQCDNRICVMKHWRCDGDNDCGDNSDEQNCGGPPPGSDCSASEFQCVDSSGAARQQCVPRTFQCDGRADCQDGSDEFGCASPVIVEQPPSVVVISIGDVFIIKCRAVGKPTPEITWRRNWNHVPSKCRQESRDGRGTLTCPDASAADQGAYSCEAINTRGVVFAIPDTNVVVTNGGLCQPPQFNNAALTNDDCQNCFCFGATSTCYSSSLNAFTRQDLSARDVRLVSSPARGRLPGDVAAASSAPYSGPQGEILARLPNRFDDHFFELAGAFGGNQLTSYGGYIRFRLSAQLPAQPGAALIIKGNDVTLLHRPSAPASDNYAIQLTEGKLDTVDVRGNIVVADRASIMMALQNIDSVLIPATSADGSVASFSSFRVDSAQRADTTQGPATLVEECRCPPGYTGMSCEECAPGYERRPGDFLGTCVEEAEECRPGEYGDPRRGIACRPCPCPGPRFQFGSTCFLDTDDQVTCNCEPGYAGRRCERCAPGYRGQPGRGQPCVRGGECDPAGSLRDDPDPRTGLCDCKEFVTGSRCDRCVPRAFHLSASNQHGCVNCFCMGVTDQCSSSDWYRQQESLVFSTDGLDVRDTITDYEMDQVLTQGTIDSANQQLVFTYYEGLGDDNPLYWNLPAQFLGDQVTAYGGSLRFSQSYAANVAAESFSSYPDVEIMGNDVRLQHILEVDVLPNQPWTLEVPMLEQAWQRHDGVRVDREHLMMALADLEYIIIKAAHFRGASRSTLSNVQLDVASPRATGQARAHAVEKCSCPVGYKGLSCEDCDVGFTRSLSGLYLRSCARCDCSGRSSECDPETGECLNCRENTSGPRCELCAVGYAGDPSRGRPCRPRAGRLVCSCDSRGSQTTECDSQGRCNCKENVEGDQCDRCRPGYFGLGTDPVTGCTSCFCSGVSRECSSAPFYQSHLPMQVYDEHHGFVLVTRDREGSTSDATETIEFNAGDNEVSFQEGPTGSGVKYWMLPDLFTGEQMSSYGGLLTMRQRISLTPSETQIPDSEPDVIIFGDGVEVHWRNTSRPPADDSWQSYAVRLSSGHSWTDSSGAPASRDFLMTVLSNVEGIAIRAGPQSAGGVLNSRLRNVVLGTASAVPLVPSLIKVDIVENCRCPAEYKGISCQSCSDGYYLDKDRNACVDCPCNGNARSCSVDEDGAVQCQCNTNYSGANCEIGGEPDTTAEPAPPPSPPRVTISPRYLQLRAGEPAQLECQAEGSPPPALHWTGGRNDIIEPDVSLIDGLLVISSVQKAHEAEYTCTATNAAGSDSARTIIYVSAAEPTAPPPTVGPAAPQRLVVPAGGTLQLDCSSAQADVVALWSRLEGQQLSQGASQLNGQLTIVDMQPADEGVYICTMTDPQDPGYREEMRAEVRVPRATRLTIKPERQTARQGGSAELQCQASDGSAGGEVRWSRAGQPLPAGAEQAGGSLLLRNIAPADRGVYVCSVDGAQSSAIVEVERLEHPVVELYPATSQQVVSGGSALIQCRVTAGQPEPQLSWTRADGSPLPRSAEQVSGGVIRFLRVTGEEDGQYVCTATNAAGSARALAILDVMSPPVIRLEQPTLYRVSEGQRVQLRCSASGDPTPSVTWEGGGVRSGVSGVPGRAILYIDDASAADAGVYTCRAENDAGRASDRLRLVVEPADDGRRPAAGGGRPPVYPSGSARPSEEVYVVPLNGSAELICLVEGSSPPVRITWVRSSGNMPDNHEVRDGTLYIFRVQKEAEGTYTCLGHGADQQVLFRADATLRVIEPPRVQVEPLRQVVQLGDAVSIQCSATGDEPISVSWERLSGPMPDSASVVQGIIAFSSIAESDAGRYICVAENTAGRAQGVAEVLVSEGARIVAFDRDVRAYVGGTVTMRCDSSGFDGRISWSREEGPLPDSAVADDISLTLSDVDESAAGRYVCWVLDQYGRRQEDVITLQIEPPGPEPLAVACAPGMFPCMSGECLAIGDFCDGQPDCADGSDESGCSPQYGQGRNAALSLPPEETPLESTANDAVADDTATDGAVADDTAADDTAADDDAAYDTAANDAVADDTAADDTAADDDAAYDTAADGDAADDTAAGDTAADDDAAYDTATDDDAAYDTAVDDDAADDTAVDDAAADDAVVDDAASDDDSAAGVPAYDDAAYDAAAYDLAAFYDATYDTAADAEPAYDTAADADEKKQEVGSSEGY